MQLLDFEDKPFQVAGRLLRTVRLQAEGYQFVESPPRVLEQLRSRKIEADLLTFTQPLSKPVPKFEFHYELDSFAVVRIENYETWWKKLINDKTRNMVRKAAKKGVIIRMAAFDDQLVSGIEKIHNESPIRQGKPFKHFGKPFETVKRDHASFVERSDFIGAYYEEQLIGVIKLVHQGEWSTLMQIISMVSHRDKAPTNALIAKAVEICAERGVTQLQYGIWSTGGIGDFKLHHGFRRMEVPRYFVPLSLRGRVAMKLGLHRNATELLPSPLLDSCIDLRSRWYRFKFRNWRPDGLPEERVREQAKA